MREEITLSAEQVEELQRLILEMVDPVSGMLIIVPVPANLGEIDEDRSDGVA